MSVTQNFNAPAQNGQSSSSLKTILTFDNIFRFIVIALVGVVGIVALALSYDALYLMASEHGHEGWKAYAWPTLIDVPLVVFTLTMLYAQIRRMSQRTIISLLGLVLAYTGVTVYLNFLESDGTIEGIFVRVSAPVGLFVCTEVLRHLLRFEIEQKGKQATLVELDTCITEARSNLHQLNQTVEDNVKQVQDELNRLMIQANQSRGNLTQINAHNQTTETIPTKPSDETKQMAFIICAEWEAAGQSLNRKGAALARELSLRLGRTIGRKTGRNLLNAYLFREMGTEKNGNGSEKVSEWDWMTDPMVFDENDQDASDESVTIFYDRQLGGEA
ncbi:MAG: DUF2637 domain-containing protein [Chloroflexota bacterium]